MKEKIYTIPVTDALKESDFCPFCYMQDLLEQETLEYTLGASYMEDDIRAMSDEKGFCNRHYEKIMNEQNKLGVALMSHTHIQKLLKDIESLKNAGNAKKPLFKKVNNPQNQLVSYLEQSSKTCYMCSRVDDTLSRYLDSFIYLFKNDSEIKRLFLDSKGMCYTHLSKILFEASSKLNEKDYEELKNIVIDKELENLRVLEEDLDFFIKKFDYKNSSLPWGDKRDVLSRVNRSLK